MSNNGEVLSDMEDEELGRLVRNTAAFRAAAACAKFADEAAELQENDSLAFDRLIKQTHAKQNSNVSKLGTTETIVKRFIEVVEEHAEMAKRPEDAAENAASEVVDG